MEIKRNFIGSKMNKDLDERLLPEGVYKDALNIDITQDAQSEGGSAKNTLGNTEIVSLSYEGQPLSNEAKTIGSFEDGANETLYWFTTDPTLDVDIISSYNFSNGVLRYHYIGDLGFDSKFRINDVDLIDDLLFFTDDKNPPRRINVNRSYSGNDSSELNVIVAPPKKSPDINLVINSSEQNYIKDKFVSFAYRYRYKDGEYSALSQFSDYAFATSNFKINYSTFLMEGMENAFNAVDVSFNTGSRDVVAIDLCFKLSDQNIINVIERFYKKEKGYGDNENAVVRFDNKKIYTTLTDDQLLRRYDNVPRSARTQCRMGNRIFYGNTLEGYNIDEAIDIDYEAISEDSGIREIESTESDGVAYGFDDGRTIQSSTIDIDLNGTELTKGSTLLISFDVVHNAFNGSAYSGAQNDFIIDYAFNLPRDYADAETLIKDPVFIDSIVSSRAINDCSNGYSLTDNITCKIVTDSGWDIVDRGITNSDESVSISESGGVVFLQLPAFKYQETATPTNEVVEYLSLISNGATLLDEGSNNSLHSDRDFELAIEYQDEYKRSTTALVNQNNTVYISPDKSNTKNFVRATIKNNPPEWAKFFRFLIKPNKGLYDVVYSNIYFQDPSNGFWWFKLDGENINKVKEGDVLYIKSDSDGATQRRIKATVLEIKVNERDFIKDNTNEDGEDIIEPTGIYMRLSPSAINVSEEEYSFITYGELKDTTRSSLFQQIITTFRFGLEGLVLYESREEHAGLAYPLYYEEKDSSGNVIGFVEYDIPRGSRIKIDFRDTRDKQAFGCGSRNYEFNREFTANEDYDSFEDWFRSNNIDISEPTNSPRIESSDDTKPTAEFISAVGSELPSYNASVTKVQFIKVDGKPYLAFKSGNKKCTFRDAKIYVNIEVQRAGGLFAFETEPQEVDGATFFEGSQSFEIKNGTHRGNVQDQTSSQPAVIDLDFHDCYTFGNGVESVKVFDSIAGAPVQLGERVSAVSREEYREIRRFSNISYSGVYNLENNLNRLNEFNLGLANFKVLEQLYGDLNKLHSYQTDMLAIQEDKISYVLTGKDLLTDARGDSAITSVPDVLGNQIARSEEFGISNNPESFASYGYYKFFTDAKRNSVISLTGNSYKNDKVEVISDTGMKNWFRDLFLNEFNTEKIGAYDPFSNMYTLTSGDGDKPKTINNVSCGLDLNQKNSNSTIEYNVQYSDITGTASIDYNFSSGSATLEVVYDGSTVINQSISGQGVVNFNKDKVNVSHALVTIIPDNATYSLSVNCVDEVPLTVIKAILNTGTDAGSTIESAYSWSNNGYTSPRYRRELALEKDGTSLFDPSSGNESQGLIPSNGSTINMFSIRNELNTLDNSSVSFKYLLSNTLYTDEQLLNLTLQEANRTQVSDTIYDANFTFDRSGGEAFLYLIWDYRLPQLNVIKAVLNKSSLAGETVNTSYFWSDNYFKSQKDVYDITFESDGVSFYDTSSGVESEGFIPKRGGSISMISEANSTSALDNSTVEFKYLLSNTLYTESELSALSYSFISKTETTPNDYKGEFNYNNPNNLSYLYLIWDYPETVTEFLEVDPDAFSNITPNEQTLISDVTSNIDWSVSSNVSWVQVTPSTGQDNGTLSILVSETTSESGRTGIITVTGTGLNGTITRTISVSQQGVDTTEPDPSFLIATPDSFQSLSANQQTVTVNLDSNLSWSESTSASFLTISPSSGFGSDTLTVTVAENTSTSGRTGLIQLTGGGLTEDISVNQVAASSAPSNTEYRGVDPFCEQGGTLYLSLGSDDSDTVCAETSSSYTVSYAGDFEVGMTINVPVSGNVDSFKLIDATGDASTHIGKRLVIDDDKILQSINECNGVSLPSFTFTSDWNFTDEGGVAAGQNGAERSYTSSNLAQEPLWSVNYNGYGLRIDWEDSLNCGGNNDLVQIGTASATINANESQIIYINWKGIAELEDSGFENMTVSIDSTVIGTATSAGGSLECEMGDIISQNNYPNGYNLSAGSHTITVNTTTTDNLFHVDSYYQFLFSTSPVTDF